MRENADQGPEEQPERDLPSPSARAKALLDSIRAQNAAQELRDSIKSESRPAARDQLKGSTVEARVKAARDGYAAGNRDKGGSVGTGSEESELHQKAELLAKSAPMVAAGISAADILEELERSKLQKQSSSPEEPSTSSQAGEMSKAAQHSPPADGSHEIPLARYSVAKDKPWRSQWRDQALIQVRCSVTKLWMLRIGTQERRVFGMFVARWIGEARQDGSLVLLMSHR